MNWDSAINGIIDDMERIVRPRDAQGNLMPMATVGIDVSNENLIKVGIAAVLVGVAVDQVSTRISKKLKKKSN